MNPDIPQQAARRLERLLAFLEQDPGNTALLADAAAAAFDAHDLDQATRLIDRYAATEPPTPAILNLQGLVAIAQQRFADAAAVFSTLREQADDPALRFNLAWSLAMTGAYREALDLLDDDVLAVSRRAPALKIQMMHHLEMYDAAMAAGEALAERFADNQTLMGVLATLAMDAEKPELALQYATRAGDDAEGQTALGLLMLGEQNTKDSMTLFDNAIARQPRNPRAWMGKGLGLLVAGDKAAGVEAIDRGAELFGDHIGSWVASGWAHFLAGSNAGARASFERARAIDDNFAESHGGLAVIDVTEGKLDDAARRSEIALRLDRQCFGAALAKSMLLEKGGNAKAAQRIRDIALSTPIGPNGQTIAQALVGFSSGLK